MEHGISFFYLLYMVEKSFAIKFLKIRLLGEIYYFNIGLETSSTGSGSLWITKSSLATSFSNSLSILECHLHGAGEKSVYSEKVLLNNLFINFGLQILLPSFVSHIQMILLDRQESTSFCLTFFMVQLRSNIACYYHIPK